MHIIDCISWTIKYLIFHGYKFMLWMKRAFHSVWHWWQTFHVLIMSEMRAQIRIGRLQCPLFMLHLNGNGKFS